MELKIEYLPVSELKPYENNPRINDAAVPYVVKSIEEFGFKNPIILQKDNVIIAGHTRVKAAKQLGIKEVPCIYADDLSEEQVKAFRLADNKVAEIAAWDFGKLEEELAHIDIDMGEFGFSNYEIGSFFEEEQEDVQSKGETLYKVVCVCNDIEEKEMLIEWLEEHGISYDG